MVKSKDVVGWGETALEDMNFQDMLDAGVIDISEIDDVIAVKQEELIGVPFVLYEWDIKPSLEFGGSYATVRIKTAGGTRVFTDGGVGIQEQLERYQQRRLKLQSGETPSPIYFHFGLRSSTYNKEIDGKMIQATTYYFDNRPRP